MVELAGRNGARVMRVGRTRGLPVDGASARDLRALADTVDADAQLTGLVAPPTGLTHARAPPTEIWGGETDHTAQPPRGRPARRTARPPRGRPDRRTTRPPRGRPARRTARPHVGDPIDGRLGPHVGDPIDRGLGPHVGPSLDRRLGPSSVTSCRGWEPVGYPPTTCRRLARHTRRERDQAARKRRGKRFVTGPAARASSPLSSAPFRNPNQRFSGKETACRRQRGESCGQARFW